MGASLAETTLGAGAGAGGALRGSALTGSVLWGGALWGRALWGGAIGAAVPAVSPVNPWWPGWLDGGLLGVLTSRWSCWRGTNNAANMIPAVRAIVQMTRRELRRMEPAARGDLRGATVAPPSV